MFFDCSNHCESTAKQMSLYRSSLFSTANQASLFPRHISNTVLPARAQCSLWKLFGRLTLEILSTHVVPLLKSAACGPRVSVQIPPTFRNITYYMRLLKKFICILCDFYSIFSSEYCQGQGPNTIFSTLSFRIHLILISPLYEACKTIGRINHIKCALLF